MGKLAGTLVAGSIFVVGTAFAVQPPDVVASDGANNTAMGTDALKSLTDGTDNTASGEFDVVAGSASGQLAGLRGHGTAVARKDGTTAFSFDFELPAQ